MSLICRLPLALLLAGAVVWAGASDGDGDSRRKSSFPAITGPELHNAHRVTDKVVSGAAPEGDAAFRKLRDLGIKTIISVDGAKPDVALARRHGLRYVHLPIGYDDVAPQEGLALARAIDELPGPVYVHCHHGKHRSAAAVAVACVVNGSLKPEQAEAVLTTFGTGQNYSGLWASARAARPVDKGVLAAVKVAYVETAKVPPVAEAMVDIDKTFDRLKASAAAGWRAPANHPDVDPPHEALQLTEKLRELGRDRDVIAAHPQEFRDLLRGNELEAQSLHEALTKWSREAAAGTQAPASLNASLKTISTSCTTCHKAYRD